MIVLVPDVIVVTGPPGAGKSTVAELLVSLYDPSALVLGDQFFSFLRSGAVSPWLSEAHAQNAVVIESAAAASGRLAEHCQVVYDGVLGPWFLPTFIKASGLKYLHYAILLPPLHVCLQRISTRSEHGFTDVGAGEDMWHQFQRGGISPQHVLVDADDQPADIAHALAERVRTGSLRHP